MNLQIQARNSAKPRICISCQRKQKCIKSIEEMQAKLKDMCVASVLLAQSVKKGKHI